MDASNTDLLKKKVEQALNDIRPYLEADGGDVQVMEVSDDMVVKLELLGSCSHCPMSVMTMKAGIEETIKRLVPEVNRVDAINITSPDDPHAKLPDHLS